MTPKQKYDKQYYQSIKGRGSKYKCIYKATEEQWIKYRDSTNCECCGVRFSTPQTGSGKCQDHDHQTGKLRGVICRNCNTSEGLCQTPERAYQVACYMATHTDLGDLIKGATDVI